MDEITLGTLEDIIKQYNQLIRERRTKVGNTEWCEDWESHLTEKEKDIIRIGNGIKSNSLDIKSVKLI